MASPREVNLAKEVKLLKHTLDRKLGILMLTYILKGYDR